MLHLLLLLFAADYNHHLHNFGSGVPAATHAREMGYRFLVARTADYPRVEGVGAIALHNANVGPIRVYVRKSDGKLFVGYHAFLKRRQDNLNPVALLHGLKRENTFSATYPLTAEDFEILRNYSAARRDNSDLRFDTVTAADIRARFFTAWPMENAQYQSFNLLGNWQSRKVVDDYVAAFTTDYPWERCDALFFDSFGGGRGQTARQRRVWRPRFLQGPRRGRHRYGAPRHRIRAQPRADGTAEAAARSSRISTIRNPSSGSRRCSSSTAPAVCAWTITITRPAASASRRPTAWCPAPGNRPTSIPTIHARRGCRQTRWRSTTPTRSSTAIWPITIASSTSSSTWTPAERRASMGRGSDGTARTTWISRMPRDASCSPTICNCCARFRTGITWRAARSGASGSGTAPSTAARAATRRRT